MHNVAFDIKCTVLLFLQFLADLIYSNRAVTKYIQIKLSALKHII